MTGFFVFSNMAKNWWFKFDFKVWRTDSDLRRCSLETRGFWLECLCVMQEAEAYTLAGSYEELGWLIGCSPEIVARCCVELQRTKTADVTLGNGNVTLLSRRLKREVSDREQTRLRVQRHRCNGDVTVQSKSKSNKKEKEEEIYIMHEQIPTVQFDYPVQDLIDAFPDYLPDRLTPSMIGFLEAEIKPADAEAWKRTIDIYRMNFNPMTKSYLPEKTANILSVFRKQKADLSKENGTHKSNTYGRKRTDQDVFAESADFYANYDEQPIA